MVEWHGKSLRKPSGGMRHTVNRTDKKLHTRGGTFAATSIASAEKAIKVENVRKRGGKLRQKAVKVMYANVSGGEKTFRAKILVVTENLANRLYTRRNILTQGAIIKIETPQGEKFAKITSRPGHSGDVNAVVWEGTIKSEEVKKALKEHKEAIREKKDATKEQALAKRAQKAEKTKEKKK